MAVGTLTYMAPEQARGLPSQIDARSDLFSVAATAFRIVAGRPVHSRSKPGELLLAMATQVAPRLQSVAPHVPPELCRVIDVGLAYAKDHRYPDARTMRADLQAVRHGRPPPFAGSQLDSHRGETGTVPDYPFEPTPSDEAPETDETLHLGTPESVPPAIDSSPGSALPSEEVPSEHTTVPFAGVPERSALDATNSGTTDEYRSSRSTQPMGSFSGSDEKE
jgi:serine/threonine-protein kinase